MKKFKNTIVFFLLTYPAGVLIGLTFWLLRFVGALKVKGWKNFPHWRQKVLVVSNHPYKGEQFLLTGLFFHQYFFRPFKYGPWSMADRKNYYERYPIFQPKLIPVDRNGNGDAASLFAAKNIMASGASLVLFPEGGRTSKGNPESLLVSQNGKKMRPLKGGFAILAAEPEVVVLPMWFEFNSWRRMGLTIGKTIVFVDMSREEIVGKTQKILLELADMAS